MSPLKPPAVREENRLHFFFYRVSELKTAAIRTTQPALCLVPKKGSSIPLAIKSSPYHKPLKSFFLEVLNEVVNKRGPR